MENACPQSRLYLEQKRACPKSRLYLDTEGTAIHAPPCEKSVQTGDICPPVSGLPVWQPRIYSSGTRYRAVKVTYNVYNNTVLSACCPITCLEHQKSCKHANCLKTLVI